MKPVDYYMRSFPEARLRHGMRQKDPYYAEDREFWRDRFAQKHPALYQREIPDPFNERSWRALEYKKKMKEREAHKANNPHLYLPVEE